MKKTIAATLAAVALIGVLAVMDSADYVVMGDTVVEVEQGPAVIVQLLYNPPSWAAPLVVVLMIGVAGLAYLGYRRHGIDEQVKAEITERMLLILFVFGLTITTVELDIFPYVVDVAIGGIGGYGLSRITSRFVIY